MTNKDVENNVVKVDLIEEELEVYQLLQGYKDETGVIHKDFTIKEMTGVEEEAISKNNIKNNGGKVIRVLLENCMLNIGTITKSSVGTTKWREIIQSLAVGDQDWALLKIREISLGTELVVGHKCPQCEQELKTTFETSELEVKEYNGIENFKFELPKGYRDKKGQLHKFGTMRHPNGLDREVLSQVVQNNAGVANTMLLARCIQKFDGLPAYDQVIRLLSIKDREYLVDLLTENEFGLVLKTEIMCTSCGHMFEGNLNTSNFI